MIYDETLHWDNWSWGSTVNLSATTHVREGSQAMAVTYNSAWAGLQLHHDGLDTSPYGSLRFALYADGGWVPSSSVKVYGTSGTLASVGLSSYLTPASGGWYDAEIPLADLNAIATTLTRLVLQDRSGGAQPTFYVDSVHLAGT